MPVTMQTSPTGVNEKNESGSYPAAERVSLTIRFGGVPIRVIMPPMLLANARGMRSLPEVMPALFARLTTIGSIRATVPVLLTKAPIAEVTSITSRNSLISLFPASLRIRELIILASPVWKIAPPTTKRPIIMITTLLENPERASSGVRTPVTIRAIREHSATMSERTFPDTKKADAMTRITKVIII